MRDVTRDVGSVLKKGDVVYESTVYPGVTKDICGGILEEESGLKKFATHMLVLKISCQSIKTYVLKAFFALNSDFILMGI